MKLYNGYINNNTTIHYVEKPLTVINCMYEFN